MSLRHDSTTLRTRIKICGLTRPADVDAAVGSGADAVGFVLWPQSPRCVGLERAAHLARRLPPLVTPVLLFVNPSVDEVAAAHRQLPQAVIQLHGDETPAHCLAVTQDGRIPFLRAARIPLGAAGAGFDVVKFARHFAAAQAILLDAQVAGYGGGGHAFQWSLLPKNVNAHLVLSGGLTPANVADGITQVRPRALSLAVDVSSGVEEDDPARPGQTRKGLKSAEKIARFAAAVRAADAALAGLAQTSALALPPITSGPA
jgi:phosphoribosylanthranilate isomerase